MQMPVVVLCMPSMSQPSNRSALAALLLTAAIIVGYSLYLARPEPGTAPAVRGEDSPGSVGSSSKSVTEPARQVVPPSASPSVVASVEQRLQQLLDSAPKLHGRDAERLFASAIRDADSSVRLEALQLSASAASPEVDQVVLPAALQDADPGIRDRAIERINELPVARRIEFFAGALHGASEEAAAKAAEWLGVLGGKTAVEALVTAWPQVAGRARSGAVRTALTRLTGRSFATAGEAQSWWSKTAATVDKDLLPTGR